MSAALAGMLAGFSLIIAIGAQNAFVLRQGIRGEPVARVVAVCAVSDLVLILAGTLGIGVLVTANPLLLVGFKWAGAAYLLWFAVRSFRSALRPQGLDANVARSAGSVVMTAIALTWLNPHVYLDTVVLLGALANQHGGARWAFALGACLASLIWFPTLGFGAKALATPLAKPEVWRLVDIAVGMVMATIAVGLVLA